MYVSPSLRLGIETYLAPYPENLRQNDQKNYHQKISEFFRAFRGHPHIQNSHRNHPNLAFVVFFVAKEKGIPPVMPLVRFTGLFLIAIILTGCGFHLRGSFVLPKAISPLYIEIYGTEQGGRQLHINELTVLLEANDVIVTSNRQDASAILVLGTEVLDKRTLSVDSNTGKERERELAYTISYRLLASDGKELLPRQVVSLVRDYVFDEDVALSTSREEHILYQEMRQEAAQQILRRLAAWSP